MKIIQRMKFEKKHEEYLFKALEDHPNSFTDVWISTLYGYPTNKAHSDAADYYRDLAEKFRAKGIKVSLQLSNTIGHGAYSSAQLSGNNN